MTKISEAEFARICKGINRERESIIKYNPIGPPEEILLWMLLGCLTSYLNLSDIEMPCFNGKPDAKTYRDALEFVLRDRRTDEFETARYFDLLASAEADRRHPRKSAAKNL